MGRVGYRVGSRGIYSGADDREGNPVTVEVLCLSGGSRVGSVHDVPRP